MSPELDILNSEQSCSSRAFRNQDTDRSEETEPGQNQHRTRSEPSNKLTPGVWRDRGGGGTDLYRRRRTGTGPSVPLEPGHLSWEPEEMEVRPGTWPLFGPELDQGGTELDSNMDNTKIKKDKD